MLQEDHASGDYFKGEKNKRGNMSGGGFHVHGEHEGSLYVIGKPQLHYSLPSGHAVFATMIAAALWPILNRYWRIAAVFFLLWVGISRVSLGAHFPADVLAGFLLSLLVVVLVRFLINRSRVLAVSEG